MSGKPAMDGGGVAQQLHVVLGDVLRRARRQAHRREDALDQRRLEAGLLGGVRSRAAAFQRGEDLLEVAEGQLTGLAGVADLVDRAWAIAAGVHSPSYCGIRPRSSSAAACPAWSARRARPGQSSMVGRRPPLPAR